METNPDDVYSLARTIKNHPEVAEVEASGRRITVAHVSDDRHANSIPKSLFDFLTETISDTKFTWEVVDPTTHSVEVHRVTGGSRNNPIAGPIGTDKVELQAHFVEERR